MKNFDEYTSDQFPLRANFIKLKNTYNYIKVKENLEIFMLEKIINLWKNINLIKKV